MNIGETEGDTITVDVIEHRKNKSPNLRWMYLKSQ